MAKDSTITSKRRLCGTDGCIIASPHNALACKVEQSQDTPRADALIKAGKLRGNCANGGRCLRGQPVCVYCEEADRLEGSVTSQANDDNLRASIEAIVYEWSVTITSLDPDARDLLGEIDRTLKGLPPF